MKKLITSFMVLFFLIGAGTKSYGQAAGDYVFTQATDNLWATTGNWSTSDGAGNLTVATRTPTATDNVWIPATKVMSTVIAKSSATAAISTGSTTVTLTVASTSITVGMAVKITASNNINTIIGLTPGTYVTAINGTTVTLSQPVLTTGSSVSLDFYPACKNLTVNGTLTVSSQLVVFGDVTVNSGGILTLGSDMYCGNITNYGTFNANTGWRSTQRNLYFGYYGAIPGTDNYTLINDGIFGSPTIDMPAVGANGSGIKLQYSNKASSVTIKPSSPTVSGYKFNIALIVPTAYNKSTASTNLYIKESMSLLIHNSMGLSVQNNDTCPNTTRTCTIDPGVTVYLGYNFHANRSVTTADQGNFVYNIYGTLDLGTYASSSNNTTASATNTTAFSLCMSTVAGNTGSLTFNLGDGTQANAGTLVLGSNVQLIKQSAQTIAINFKDYSTVQVTGNYGQAMNYQLLNNNNPALYLFPNKFYNLTLKGAGVILPVVAAIKGTKDYASTGTPAWVANASTAQGSIISSVTNSVTSYYYVPVVRGTSTYLTNNPISLVADTILNYLRVGQTATGNNIPTATTITGILGNSITLSAAPNATVTQTNAIVTFTGGKSDAVTAPTGTSSNPFNPVMDGTQGLIYLGGPEFITASTIIPTAVNSPETSNVLVYSSDRNKLVISNANAGDIASVYSISGIRVASVKLTSDKTTLSIASGIYLVKINTSVSKVVVR